MKRYQARWVVPVTSAPIENGVVVEHDGIIEYVGPIAGAPAGEDQDLGESAMAVLKERVAELQKKETELVRIGISPHAPYTISDDLYSATAQFARESGLRMALHIAESASETEIVCAATGPFAVEWNVRGLPISPRARSPIALLEKTGFLPTSPLRIH